MKIRWAIVVLGAMLSFGTAGCFNPFDPVIAVERSIATPPPNPNTPRNLLLLFEWAYERQDITVYEELLSADYRFAFADEDAAGNPPYTRDDELQVARNLFIVGSATEPPANKITLTYLTDILARPDRRPGKTDPWHKEILVRVQLRVETDVVTHQVDGRALFFVVRGDSAQIPPDLQLRGFGPDSNRWYIERWEDQTGSLTSLLDAIPLAGSPAPRAARPILGIRSTLADAARTAGPLSEFDETNWGRLKLLYR